MRFGYILCPTVRFCAVFQYRKTYGAVRFGFEEGKNPTVRFGAVFQYGNTYGAVRFGFEEGKNLTVRLTAPNR